MNLRKAVLLFLFPLLCSITTQGQPVVVFSDLGKIEKIGRQVFVFEDTSNKLTINDVIGSTKFESRNADVPNLGVTTSTFWVKFTIQNATGDANLLLDLAQPTLNVVELYQVTNGAGLLLEKTGTEVPFTKRKYSHQNYLFDISLPKGLPQTFFMKIKSGDQVMLPLSVGDSRLIMETATRKDMIFGIFFGLMMVMFLYNLFIYFTVRDSSYLYYVLYILMVCLMQATLQGYSCRYLWPNNLWLAKSSVFLLPSLAGLTAMLFARVFLQAKTIVPKLNKVLSVLIGIFCLAIACLFFGNYRLSFGIMQLDTIIGSLFVLFLSYVVSKKGNRSAKFFLIAWSILLVGATIFVLKDFGVLPYDTLTNSILEIGTATEAVLLSFALADKINIFRKEKELSQAQTLAALQENEKLIREQNVVLEAKVTERTHELKIANEDLSKAMVELKEAESQLVESEKMASLGQLTAGIAHEINNPINFVTSNIKPLNRDVHILLDTVAAMEKMATADGINAAELKKQIAEYKEEIDFDYLKTEIDQLLDGIGDGASRTAEIVKGLRIFSRLDEDDLKKADINEGLDSTLVITNNLLSSKIKVEKKYGNLPLVECYPGKLNQVFLNIISNGIYAIKKKFGDQAGGLISISTNHDETHIRISIADNGTGMDENTKKRLYEPFFTTKDVGEGTGLGMSISYNTIVKHNGQIQVNSEIGVGTEFLII
jgi:signal transduction histidine kinase